MIDTSLIMSSLPYLLRGAVVTLEIAALSCAIGLTLGTFLGVSLARSNPLIRGIIRLYTTLLRGTPMIIQIFFVIYALPQLGLRFSPFWGVIASIGLNSSAYICHIIKSGIDAIDKGQLEAAKVLGLSPLQTVRYIILPQALTIVLPALGNEFITLVKDSSLASFVGVTELTKEGAQIVSRTYSAITIYAGVALIYLIITSTLSLVVLYYEKRINHRATP